MDLLRSEEKWGAISTHDLCPVNLLQDRCFNAESLNNLGLKVGR
jgi:hypothetical protein